VIIHGDLSPTNVLLSSSAKDRRGWVCKLADFGLSKCGDVSNFCKRSSILGTGGRIVPICGQAEQRCRQYSGACSSVL
jgi:serine/threonine protein kinase